MCIFSIPIPSLFFLRITVLIFTVTPLFSFPLFFVYFFVFKGIEAYFVFAYFSFSQYYGKAYICIYCSYFFNFFLLCHFLRKLNISTFLNAVVLYRATLLFIYYFITFLIYTETSLLFFFTFVIFSSSLSFVFFTFFFYFFPLQYWAGYFFTFLFLQKRHFFYFLFRFPFLRKRFFFFFFFLLFSYISTPKCTLLLYFILHFYRNAFFVFFIVLFVCFPV